jgi:hypothetical protein
MDTPWHAFWTYVVFHRKNWWTKAVIASALPDAPFFISSAYFFVRDGVNIKTWVLAYQHPWVKPFGFFSHSLVISALGLVVAFFLGKRYLYPYFYGWIFHIFTDLLTHVSDAQPVFWPLSDTRFPGPISYWEPNYHSRELGIANLVVSSVFAIYLVLTKSWRSPNHPTGQIVLFGFLFVYILGGGILMFQLGWTSVETLILHLISGGLFFFIAIMSIVSKSFYNFSKANTGVNLTRS